MALALVSGAFIQRYSQTLRPAQSSPGTAHRRNPKHQQTEGKSKPRLQPTSPAAGPGGRSANAGGTQPSAEPGQVLASSSEGRGRPSGTGVPGVPAVLPTLLPGWRRQGQCRPGAGWGLTPPSSEEGTEQCRNRCPGDLTKARTHSARAGGLQDGAVDRRPCKRRVEPLGHRKRLTCPLPSPRAQGSPQPGSEGEREWPDPQLRPCTGEGALRRDVGAGAPSPSQGTGEARRVPELRGSPRTASLQRRGRAAAQGASHLPWEPNSSLWSDAAHRGHTPLPQPPRWMGRTRGAPSRQPNTRQPQRAQLGAEASLPQERERARLGAVRAAGAVPSPELAHAHPSPGAKAGGWGAPSCSGSAAKAWGPAWQSCRLARRC